MSRKQIAQIVPTENAYIPSKVSLHLRPAGTSNSYFELSSSETIVIDAVNFYRFQDESVYLLVADSDPGFTGAGYLLTKSASAGPFDLTEATTVTYPIRAIDDGKYYIHLRIKGTYSIHLLVDNVSYNQISETNASWGWVTTNFVAFDESIHQLGLGIRSADTLIDKIVISKSPTPPTSTGPEYTDSPYCTIVCRLSRIDDQVPTTFFDVMDAKNTVEDITTDGWYNFNISAKTSEPDIATADELGVAVLSAGATAVHYAVWDTAEDVTNPIASQVDLDGWIADNQTSMAVYVYSDLSSVDEYCVLNTPEAQLKTFQQSDFSPVEIRPKLENTVYVDDDAGGSDVELDVSEKLITVVMDQSGSMTWNDNTGLRHQFANQILDIVEAKYPSDIRYNLISFKGEPCFSFFVALDEKITSNTIADIIRSHFKYDSDYFAGFRVLRKEGSYSESPIDGEIVHDGYALAALDIDLKEDTQYYYTVYTYDQKFRFSRGIQIAAKTADLVVPRGVPNFKGTVLAGYDLRSDANTVALWNTDESSGDYVYDFAGNNALTLENTRWLSIFDSPAGISGLRFNGLNSRATGVVDDSVTFAFSDSFTVEGWLHPFTSLSEQTIVTQSNNSSRNWAVLLDGLTLKFDRNSGSPVSCATPLDVDVWTHVAITYNAGSVSFYINGSLVNSTTIGAHSVNTSADQFISFGYDPCGVHERYFGKISHWSVHNVARSAGEILVAATPARGADDNGNPQPVDNGDRVVVLDYAIPSDKNYTHVRIVRNATNLPTHESDGDIILDTTATVGRHSCSAGYPYDVAHSYFFRIFTKNSAGVWCDILDAHSLEILIPDVARPEFVDDISGAKSTPGPGTGDTGTVTMLVNRTGNEKVYLKWTPPDDDTTRVRIYYSNESYPYYDSETKSVAGGALIFDSVTGLNEFVHRKLPNRRPAFYAIVTADRLGRVATSNRWILALHFPISEIDDSGIPLLEAKNVSYHHVDYDRIRITWDSPVTIGNTFTGYYDQRFYVYGAICDLYGNPLPLEFPNNVAISATLNPLETIDIEDVFSLGLSDAISSRIPSIDTKINPDGLITGLVRLRPSPLFATIKSLSIDVSAKYELSSSYSFQFPSATLNYKNPLELRLVNRDNLFFNTQEYAPPRGCDLAPESGENRRVNGTHIRKKNPFAIRAFFSYKGKAISQARVATRIYDADGGPCQIAPTDLSKISTTTTLLTSNFNIIKETRPILDGGGNPTAYSETISYSDILVRPPQLPQSATVFVKLEGAGYIGLKKMHIFFPSILKIQISAAAPDSNNIDVREQFARAYLVDPDHPLDESLYTYPPENTVAKWELTRDGKTSTVVPFYSIDGVPLVNGVYSYFRSGTARNVFFGPATPTVSGSYRVTVSTVVRGLFASAFQDIAIKGREGTSFEHFIPDPIKPRILCEFENTINYLWSDGLDYQRMTITRNPIDPEKSQTKYAPYFRECSENLFPLPPNTVVTIEAKGYEILYGDVSTYVDSDGNRRLRDGNAFRNVDTAQVKLSKEPHTYVYFRKNEYIENHAGCSELESPPCAAFDAPDKICYDPYTLGSRTGVVVSTKINYNGKPLTIYGGGEFGNEGRPPCVLVPIEPLYVRYLGLFVNGVPVNDFAIDGRTVHHMYFEIRFGGKPVPTGTAFPVFACNLLAELESGETCKRINSEVGVPQFVYAYQTNELPGQIADEYQEFSIIDIPVGPITPQDDLSVGVWPEIVYNGTQPESGAL